MLPSTECPGDYILSYLKLKIVHRAGRVHSNVDPLSRLEWRIPFSISQPSNDPDINLSQEKTSISYGRMKCKFDMRASALFTSMETLSTFDIDILLPHEHPLESLCHHAATQVETHIHVNPKDIQAILDGYQNDSYFKTSVSSFPKEPPLLFKSYHRNPDSLIYF